MNRPRDEGTSEKVRGQRNFDLVLSGPLPPEEYISMHIWGPLILGNRMTLRVYNLLIVQTKLKFGQKVEGQPPGCYAYE